MSLSARTRALLRLLFAEQQAVAEDATLVVDVRGARGFTLYGSATATYQPCDSAGTTVTGSSSALFTAGTLVTPAWPYYLVTATGGDCTVAVVA